MVVLCKVYLVIMKNSVPVIVFNLNGLFIYILEAQSTRSSISDTSDKRANLEGSIKCTVLFQCYAVDSFNLTLHWNRVCSKELWKVFDRITSQEKC